jgi:hypothetical protein
VSPVPEFGFYESTHEMLRKILQNTERIMSEQVDIDAATQAILSVVTSIQTEDGNLSSAVAAIQAFIAAQPPSANTAALDTAVAQISGAQASLSAAVSSVSSIVPVPPAPPAA